MVGRIDSGLGIGVLPPGAAELGVLVDHIEGKAHFAQAIRRTQTGEAGADHQHSKAL